jgi:hypothetical protein
MSLNTMPREIGLRSLAMAHDRISVAWQTHQANSGQAVSNWVISLTGLPHPEEQVAAACVVNHTIRWWTDYVEIQLAR